MKLKRFLQSILNYNITEFSNSNRSKLFWLLIISNFMLISGISHIIAQPSGGPYGPIKQSYALPEGANNIYYVAPDGNSNLEGKSLSDPTTIESAIERVETGDAIVMRGGIYRSGNLVLNQGITLLPYKDEQPVFNGTFVADEWTQQDNGLWVTSWKHLFPSKPDNWWRRHRQGKKTPIHRFNNDMVFVDGKFLQSAGWEGEVDQNSFYIDYETGLVYISIDPTDRTIEITVFDVAITRTIKDVHGKSSDRKGPVIKGITFTQYAYRAIEIEGTEPEGLSSEENHGKDVIGTTLEHCTISFCSRVAGYFRGDSLTIRHCKISDTSTEGIYVISSSDVLLERNIFTRNNIERITGYYPAAVKIFNQCYRVTCNDNLVIDLPYSNGIWYDVGNVDGRFTNNWVEGVGNTKDEFSIEKPWPSDNGFFFEISKGAICTGNVFINCDHGVWALNSSDVLIYQNTFVNSTACISRNERNAATDHFGWHPSTGPDVDERDGHIFVNNLLTGDKDFNRLLLYVWQPAVLCDSINNSQLEELDYNVYVNSSVDPTNQLILWSPVQNDNCQLFYNSLDELREFSPNYSKNSKYFSNYSGPLFQSLELSNYQLLNSFSATNVSILKENKNSKLNGVYLKPFIGAFPAVE